MADRSQEPVRWVTIRGKKVPITPPQGREQRREGSEFLYAGAPGDSQLHRELVDFYRNPLPGINPKRWLLAFGGAREISEEAMEFLRRNGMLEDEEVVSSRNEYPLSLLALPSGAGDTKLYRAPGGFVLEDEGHTFYYVPEHGAEATLWEYNNVKRLVERSSAKSQNADQGGKK